MMLCLYQCKQTVGGLVYVTNYSGRTALDEPGLSIGASLSSMGHHEPSYNGPERVALGIGRIVDIKITQAYGQRYHPGCARPVKDREPHIVQFCTVDIMDLDHQRVKAFLAERGWKARRESPEEYTARRRFLEENGLRFDPTAGAMIVFERAVSL
jgi:hypothetical protein